jgi:hypothetical protein
MSEAAMKDYRLIQTGSALRENRLLLEEGLSFEKATELAKAKKIPVGSVWHWSSGNVWGPIGSSKQEKAA